VDSRLPPNIRPDEALAKIRRHLDANGFTDIEIRQLSGYPSSQTSVEAPLVQATIGVFNNTGTLLSYATVGGKRSFLSVHGKARFTARHGGSGHGSGAHGPNEYMVIEPAEGLPSRV